jgi:RimJ/RimL family protein N-acetyltransferase
MTRPREVISRYKSQYHLDPEGLALRAWAATGEALRLRPLQPTPEQVSPRDVALLTQWRNQYRRYFLTDFVATNERTMRWLTSTAGPDSSRILFMVEASDGEPFGHVGLCSVDEAYGELDNVVRGREGPKGSMAAAATAVCAWARSTLGLEQLWVRVMADNPAVGFYEKLGFRRVKDVPLEYRGTPEEGNWMEMGNRAGIADRYLRYMEQAA